MPLKRKKRPRLRLDDHCRGLYILFVVLFDADTAFELYLDAAGSYDDLFHQLFEYGAVIRVHDAAIADIVCFSNSMITEVVPTSYYLQLGHQRVRQIGISRDC